jgi:hypothetical protein
MSEPRSQVAREFLKMVVPFGKYERRSACLHCLDYVFTNAAASRFIGDQVTV